MSVDLSSQKQFTIRDFSGGINEYGSAYKIADNELASTQNMEILTNGALQVRKAPSLYQDNSGGGDDISNPVRGMHYYVNSAGTKQVMMYSDPNIHVDGNDGTFATVAQAQTGDGFVRFAQFQDTVIFGTEIEPLKTYQDGLSTEVGVVDTTGNIGSSPVVLDSGSHTDTGGTLDNLYYVYRFTADVYYGDDFFGETNPFHSTSTTQMGQTQVYSQVEVNLTGLAQDANDLGDNVANLIKFSNFTWDAGQRFVNVYRSDVQTASGLIRSTDEYDKFYYIGSFDATDVTSDGLSAGTTVFQDYGQPIGRKLDYNRTLRHMPRGRFLTILKGRLLLGWITRTEFSEATGADEDDVTYPYRIQISEYSGDRPEPGIFRPGNSIDIGKFDDGGLTGLISWRDKIAIAFTATTMTAISIADQEIDVGIPNVSTYQISDSIGCIAPETIRSIEGKLIWLSAQGVMYFDGTEPKPLKSEYINKTLLNLNDSLRYLCCAGVNRKERVYYLAHSNKDLSTSFNTYVSKFNFYTASWTRDLQVLGIGTFLEKNSRDEGTVLLAGIADDPTTVASAGSVFKMDDAYKEYDTTGVAWQFKTKAFDFGAPFADKRIKAILLEVDNVFADITADFVVDYDRIDTTVSGETSPTITANTLGAVYGTGSQDTPNVYGTGTYGGPDRGFMLSRNALTTRIWGKRFQMILSGTSSLPSLSISAITLFYDIDATVVKFAEG